MTTQAKNPSWVSSCLAGFSSLLRAIWLFFPGVLFVALGFVAFAFIEQGQDLLNQSLQREGLNANNVVFNQRVLLIVIGLFFWSFTTWYTSRILAYNDNKIYDNSEFLATLMPRLLGYLVYTVLGVAIHRIKYPGSWPTGYIFLSIGAFSIVYWFAQNKKIDDNGYNQPFKTFHALIIYGVISALGFGLAYFNWRLDRVATILCGIFLTQAGLILWVCFRQPLVIKESWKAKMNKWLVNIKRSKSNPTKPNFFVWVWSIILKWYQGLVKCIYLPVIDDQSLSLDQKIPEDKRKSEEEIEDFLRTEYVTFFIYNLAAIVIFSTYYHIIVDVEYGRNIGAFAFTLIAFGVLVGVGNVIALLSFRSKINWLVVFLVLGVLLGKVTEPHEARVIPLQSHNAYTRRINVEEYLNLWVQDPMRKSIMEKADDFPVFFILADGGASRSGYWVANVLSKLHQETQFMPGVSGKDSTIGKPFIVDERSLFTRHLFALAGASGGSVGNTTFVAALKAQAQNQNWRADLLCANYLKNDFLTNPLARYLGPEFINFGQWPDRAAALEESMENPRFAHESLSENSKRLKFMGNIMANDFKQFMPLKNSPWLPPILCINTTCMQNSKPGVISNISDPAFFPRLDVLDEMNSRTGIRVSTAMVLGARFPYFSPAGRLAEKYYVDGGYFDNSGAGPILQIIMKLESIKADLENKKETTNLLYRALKKMKYYVIHIENNPLQNRVEYPKVLPLLNDLAAPIFTLMRSYGAQTNFNDFRLQTYVHKINGQCDSINLYQKQSDAFPMSWYLSKPAIDTMNRRVRSSPGVWKIIKELKKTSRKNSK